MGYSLSMHDCRFLKCSHFFEYLVFFGAVFCTEQLEMISRMDFDMCFGILVFEPN